MDAMPPEALLAGYPAPMRHIAERLRRIVRRALPDAIEAVRPGWRLIGYDIPSGRKTAFCCFVWAEQEHVHLGFQYGVFMDDPGRVLEGEGTTQRVRWLRSSRATPSTSRSSASWSARRRGSRACRAPSGSRPSSTGRTR